MLSIFQSLSPCPTNTTRVAAKLNITLDPDIRADIAAKHIFCHLLKIIKENEQGTIADIDSEFLHDFRVAVRKTRVGLSQLKGILPNNTCTYFTEFFFWLGQSTSLTRDMDVYLLNFERFKGSLPASLGDDINPLHEFLLTKQQKVQQELANNLRSAKYLATLSEWEQYLKLQVPLKTVGSDAELTVKQLADHRLWKIYKRVLQQGEGITQNSHSETFHELRKSCKKLRYLMEFFQSLYPENQIEHFIKNLKELQEVLGSIQDLSVQISTLNLFSDEMRNDNAEGKTLLAMSVLIQNLDTLRSKARKDFSFKFSNFKHEDNQSVFKSILAVKGQLNRTP